MSATWLVPLDCPACGRRRDGAPGAALLACASCGIASETRPGGRSLPLRFAGVAGAGGGPAIPFYRFGSVEARARALTGDARAGVARLEALRVVWVLGVRIRRFEQYGDAGVEYTRRPPRLEPLPPMPLVPIGRSPADAAAVARVVLWRIAADACPARGFALDPALGEPEVCAVATIADGDLVKLPHGTIRYPSELIEGWPRPG